MAGGVTIYHTPKCGTSRTALGLIEAAGIAPDVVPFLETGWSRALLTRLMKRAGATPRDWLRAKEPLAAELGLTAADASDAAILKAMLAHPVLVDRPVVETPKGVRMCRPAELVNDLL